MHANDIAELARRGQARGYEAIVEATAQGGPTWWYDSLTDPSRGAEEVVERLATALAAGADAAYDNGTEWLRLKAIGALRGFAERHYLACRVDFAEESVPGTAARPVTDWYPDGRPRRTGHLRAGERVGLWREWYPSGRPAWERRPDGAEVRWRDEDFLSVDFEDTVLTPGLLVEHEGTWFTGEQVAWEHGRVEAITGYSGGMEDGPQWEWYPDGRLRSEGQCVRGGAVGQWRAWHPNGQLAERTVFDRWGDVRRRQCWDTDGTLTKDETSDGLHGGEW
ncbi:hypothetical protein GCM10010174_10110 [Kutzneria viridogrisea]|uniref:Uncharacterized protein n=2 Tax=Kutzneria TaxID=43356 RepID=W5WJL0_9PSEU|nr:hypothetical protein [Kutzneria albida]AHI01389.1 hypothetical protein KALB_8031 [Kutzneria albida DSM 43870]MBA8926639.1 hypothetical protein [Kutzneria viridogrisea]